MASTQGGGIGETGFEANRRNSGFCRRWYHCSHLPSFYKGKGSDRGCDSSDGKGTEPPRPTGIRHGAGRQGTNGTENFSSGCAPVPCGSGNSHL